MLDSKMDENWIEIFISDFDIVYVPLNPYIIKRILIENKKTPAF